LQTQDHAEKPGYRLEDNIKLVLDRNKWKAVVYAVINSRFSKHNFNVLTS